MRNSTEEFITDVLECGTMDVSMLDNVYSPLAQETINTYAIIRELQDNCMLNLNSLLYETYKQVGDEIVATALELLDEEELQENLGNDLVEKVREHLTNMEVEPFCNCIDTSFDNEIDQIVDWEDTTGSNANNLVSYIANNI